MEEEIYGTKERERAVEELLILLPDLPPKMQIGLRQKLLRVLDFSNSDIIDPELDMQHKMEQISYNEKLNGILYKIAGIRSHKTKRLFMVELLTKMYSQVISITNPYYRLEHLNYFGSKMKEIIEDENYNYWKEWANTKVPSSGKPTLRTRLTLGLFSSDMKYNTALTRKIEETLAEIEKKPIYKNSAKTRADKVKNVFESEFISNNIIIEHYENSVIIFGYWNTVNDEIMNSGNSDDYQCFQVMYKVYNPYVWTIGSIKYPNAKNCLMSGTGILKKIIGLAKRMNISHIILQDASFIYASNTEGYSLALYNILKSGKSWYGSYGFDCVYEDDRTDEYGKSDIHTKIERYRLTPINDLIKMGIPQKVIDLLSDAVNEVLGPSYLDKSVSQIISELSQQNQKHIELIMGIVQISHHIFEELFDYNYCTTRILDMKTGPTRGGKKSKNTRKMRSKKNKTAKRK